MSDVHFYMNVLKNIVISFFQGGIWIAGFFYLLLKTFENPLLKKFSIYIIYISLVILLISSILISI